MFRMILVPVDGTQDSERVLDWVKPFARMGAGLHLLTVADPHHRHGGSRHIDQTQGRDPDAAERYMHALLSKVRRDFPSTDATVVTGRPAREVLRVASKVQADLIAMESHLGSVVMRGVVGSCTDEVVRSGQYPVLVLPPGAAGIAAPEAPRTILVPLDGSELAERAIPTAVDLANAFGAELLLLRATTSAVYAADAYGVGSEQAWDRAIEFQETEAAAYLGDIADQVRGGVPAVRIEVSRSLGATAVLQALEGSPSTMAVMVTHGRGGFRRLILGSVTDKVFRSGHAPVLVLPARIGKAPSATPERVQTVADVMTSPAITVAGDTTLGHAARLMLERNIGCLPVVDGSGAFIGIISESLFLPAPENLPFSRDPIFKVFDQSMGDAKGLSDALAALRDRPVSEIMLARRATVTEDAELSQAAALMMRDAVSHVPVVRDGQVVGVVAMHDLLRLLAEES